MNKAIFEKMNRFGETYWWYKGKKIFLEKMMRDFDSRFGKEKWSQGSLTVLDIGCGAGNMFDFLRRFGSIYGVEISMDALEYAKISGATRDKQNAKLVRGMNEYLPFGDEKFDIVASFDNLEHIQDDLKALKQTRRVISPNGILLLTVPACPCLWTWRDFQLGHHRRYQRNQLKKILQNAEFKVETISYAYLCLFPLLLFKAIKDRFFPKPNQIKSDIRNIKEPWNGLLTGWLKMEAEWGARIGLPFGTSLFVIARPI